MPLSVARSIVTATVRRQLPCSHRPRPTTTSSIHFWIYAPYAPSACSCLSAGDGRREPADAASVEALAKSNPHEFQTSAVEKLGDFLLEVSSDPKVAKKSGDRGIDGVLLFRDDPKATRSQRMVISVRQRERRARDGPRTARHQGS